MIKKVFFLGIKSRETMLELEESLVQIVRVQCLKGQKGCEFFPPVKPFENLRIITIIILCSIDSSGVNAPSTP